MKTLNISIRDVPLTIVYEYSEVFDEICVLKILIGDVDIYELLGEGDREEILIKCLEDYAESSTERP